MGLFYVVGVVALLDISKHAIVGDFKLHVGLRRTVVPSSMRDGVIGKPYFGLE